MPTSLVVCLLLLALALPAGASAAAKPLLAIGEQRASVLSGPLPGKLSPLFAKTTITHVRITVPWDASKTAASSAALTQQFASFRQLGLEPLVVFGRSWNPTNPGPLMSVAKYSKMFSDFHRRFPWVTQFVSWNEVNALNQATHAAPQRVAEYYKTIRQQCPKCTTLVATLLDSSRPVEYVKQLQRYVGNGHQLIWALHNYGDVRRRQDTVTRQFVASVHGKVWLTEAGALAQYHGPNKVIAALPMSEALQAKSVKYLLGPMLARNPRIDRVYVYQWQGAPRGWDSGLVRPNGKPRPALTAVMQALAAKRVTTRCTAPPAKLKKPAKLKPPAKLKKPAKRPAGNDCQ